MDGRVNFPGWLESLLRSVHDSSGKKLSSFCITCCSGFYQENQFPLGPQLEHMHIQHTYLRMQHFQQAVTAKLEDLVRVGVNPSSIQAFYKPDDDHTLYILLHNAFRKIGPSDSMAEWPKCVHCCCQLYQTIYSFCCLDCKFRVMKNVPPGEAQLGRSDSLCELASYAKSSNQIESSVGHFPGQKDSSLPVDGSSTMTSREKGKSVSEHYEDRAVGGDLTSPRSSTCKSFGAFEFYVSKITFVGWPWWKGNFKDSWIGSLMPIKSQRLPLLLPQYEPIGKKESQTCGLPNCAICFPSEEFTNDREFDLEDHIFCLLEEGYAGLEKLESLQKPAVPMQPRFNPSTSLQQHTLNPQQR